MVFGDWELAEADTGNAKRDIRIWMVIGMDRKGFIGPSLALRLETMKNRALGRDCSLPL
jgi:hypothetical protein